MAFRALRRGVGVEICHGGSAGAAAQVPPLAVRWGDHGQFVSPDGENSSLRHFSDSSGNKVIVMVMVKVMVMVMVLVMVIAIVIADTTTSWKADVNCFFWMFLNISAQHLNLR